MNGPHSVSWKMKVKASSGLVEPIHANLFERRSICGLEMIDVPVAEAAVDAVGEHDEIGIGELRFIVDIGFKQDRHAEFAGALLQDQQQRPARAAAKSVAADAVHACRGNARRYRPNRRIPG